MQQYLDLCKHVLEGGVKKQDRTGTGTISTFGYQMRFNLDDGFPLITTKKVHLKSIIHELLWFLKGQTNIRYLNENGVTIWNEWSDEDGELGNIYGAQWRFWIDHNQPYKHENGTYTFGTIDQIKNVIDEIKSNPDSRRLIVSAWNVSDLPHMALAPCHTMFQFYVSNGKLSCQLYQRSGDVFLGIPFNIASYALLTMMIAQVCDLQLGEFIHTLGDAHIYLNHVEQVELQLTRNPKLLPTMKLNPNIKDIFQFTYDDFELSGYEPHTPIRGEVAI